MNVWDDLNKNISKTSQQWLSWAKQHAQELGDAGVRHVERQDLLSERKQLVHRIGEEVVNRFLVVEKKTLRTDSPEIAEHIERIRTIDARLSELGTTDDDTGAKRESEAES